MISDVHHLPNGMLYAYQPDDEPKQVYAQLDTRTAGAVPVDYWQPPLATRVLGVVEQQPDIALPAWAALLDVESEPLSPTN